MDGEEPARQHDEAMEAADALHAQANDILKLTECIERLTENAPVWCAGTRARIKAKAALEQTEELGRVLNDLGERLDE